MAKTQTAARKTQTAAKPAKPAAAAPAAQTYGFRVVVRGNLDGRRVRRVQTLQASDAGAAFVAAGPVAESMAKGLDNVYFNVYPPVGELCNGGISKGFELNAQGAIQRVAA